MTSVWSWAALASLEFTVTSRHPALDRSRLTSSTTFPVTELGTEGAGGLTGEGFPVLGALVRLLGALRLVGVAEGRFFSFFGGRVLGLGEGVAENDSEGSVAGVGAAVLGLASAAEDVLSA